MTYLYLKQQLKIKKKKINKENAKTVNKVLKISKKEADILTKKKTY